MAEIFDENGALSVPSPEEVKKMFTEVDLDTKIVKEVYDGEEFDIVYSRQPQLEM